MQSTKPRLVTNDVPHDPFGSAEVSRMRELLRREPEDDSSQVYGSNTYGQVTRSTSKSYGNGSPSPDGKRGR
jgi:hypothetical protein